MVVVDIDHPDIEQFINWKVYEEQKVAALVSGSKMCEKHLNRIMAACRQGEGDDRFIAKKNSELRSAIIAAREAARQKEKEGPRKKKKTEEEEPEEKAEEEPEGRVHPPTRPSLETHVWAAWAWLGSPAAERRGHRPEQARVVRSRRDRGRAGVRGAAAAERAAALAATRAERLQGPTGDVDAVGQPERTRQSTLCSSFSFPQ